MNLQFSTVVVCAILAGGVLSHDGHDHADQMPLGYVKYPYQAAYPGDNEGRSTGVVTLISRLTKSLDIGTVTADSIFSGITTFAKLPWVQCLTKDKEELFDIAFIGAPFVSKAF